MTNGYGSFYYQGKLRGAHRMSYRWAYGSIPPRAMVCHTCDNPPCVRPEHLFAGTQLDNMRDAKAKVRTTPGDKHWSRIQPDRVPQGEARGRGVKMTDQQVDEIRALHQPDVRGSQLALARQFGISPAQVCRILKGRQRRSQLSSDHVVVDGPKLKLTDAQVAELRAAYVPGRRGSKRELARRYGISDNYVSQLLAGNFRKSD